MHAEIGHGHNVVSLHAYSWYQNDLLKKKCNGVRHELITSLDHVRFA